VESSPASECPAADRSDNVREPVRNDIGLDGEWEHQQFCEGTPRCEPVGAGRCPVRVLTVFASNSLTFG